MSIRKRITLADVAAAAGVSTMTASRALRGAGDVSTKNRDKVRRAARDIGYIGNPLAASLSGKRSGLIGVVVPSISNIVFAEVLAGIADGIEGSGLQPVFGVTDYEIEKEHQVIRNMLSWSPSGLIVTGLDQADETRRLLQTANIPIVQIMDVDGDAVDACVGFSHQQAGRSMAEALIGQGRTRFAYAGCGLDQDTRARKRFEGFQNALKTEGLDWVASHTQPGRSTLQAGRAMTESILTRRPDIDCIYYSNDDLAAGGAFHAISAGLNVPKDLLLAGFNGLDLVESLPLPIATTRTPRREIGRRAAEVILARREKGASTPDHPSPYVPDLFIPGGLHDERKNGARD